MRAITRLLVVNHSGDLCHLQVANTNFSDACKEARDIPYRVQVRLSKLINRYSSQVIYTVYEVKDTAGDVSSLRLYEAGLEAISYTVLHLRKPLLLLSRRGSWGR